MHAVSGVQTTTINGNVNGGCKQICILVMLYRYDISITLVVDMFNSSRSNILWQVLFKNVIWQGLSAEERLLFLENGICPGDPNTPLNTVCRNEWMHYLVSFVQPWEPLEDVLDTLHLFVQSQKS